MPLRDEVVSAEVTQGHENYMANGNTVTVKLKNGSTRILTFVEADAEGVQYAKVGEEPKAEIKKEEEPTEPEEVEAPEEGEPTEEAETLTRDELKAALDERGIEYAKTASTKKLQELLDASVVVVEEEETPAEDKPE